MKTTKTLDTRKTARIFEESAGRYYICDNAQHDLDARGTPCRSRSEALLNLRIALREQGSDADYTHYITAGGRRVRIRPASRNEFARAGLSYSK